MSDIKLVSARAGLTNYYHNQVIRNPIIDIDSEIIDQLTTENHSGGVSPSSIKAASVHAGMLNAQPSGYAQIAGGFGESKGLMLLEFVTQDSPIHVEYMKVIGYVTNNQSMEGLTASAIFHPAMSWKSRESITSTMDINNPTAVKRALGARTDYLFNDGGNTNQSMITLRPSDVMDYAINAAARDDIMNRMQDEGLDQFTPNTTVASSDISRVGVIASKRQNLNPSKYAEDILKAGISYQRSSITNNGMDIGDTEDQFNGMFDQLTTQSYQASGTEPQLIRDSFFREMMEMMGQQQMRGFTGFTIGDLSMVFDNLNDVLDLTMMDASEFMVDDFTQNTEAFGTASTAEFVAHSIEMNILDLMLKHDLAGISVTGSNCDNWGDGALDNVVIVPYNPAGLKDDDFTLAAHAEEFAADLKSQIFARLNGLRAHELTPIRFTIDAELYGTCTINMYIVDETTSGQSFDLQNGAADPNMITRSFPTFAINSTSSILGDNESAQQAGANFFNNIEAYFQ